MNIKPLIPIGAKIKVDKSRIENLLPDKIFDNLPQMINGEIIDYKMTDGMDIGYVLITENNEKIWIFNTELNEQTRKDYKIESSNKSHEQKTNPIKTGGYKVTYEINGNKTIKKVANPINLIKWIMFTIKDIF